jgi:hypothetical protein
LLGVFTNEGCFLLLDLFLLLLEDLTFLALNYFCLFADLPGDFFADFFRLVLLFNEAVEL